MRARPIGPLEWRVLEALWARDEVVTVRDIKASFPELAYTTIMTTLDRLHGKRIVERVRTGRAFSYKASIDRTALTAQLAGDAIGPLVARDPSALRPLMCFLIDLAEKQDLAVIDGLNEIVRGRLAKAAGNEDT
jgi:predicted transcriptional regulator